MLQQSAEPGKNGSQLHYSKTSLNREKGCAHLFASYALSLALECVSNYFLCCTSKSMGSF